MAAPFVRAARFRTGQWFTVIVSIISLLVGTTAGLANPTNPTVVGGQAAFHAAGSTLTITTSDRAAIHWEGFSIGQGETTRFVQPSANSAVLNRVTGGNPSALLGTLQANGKVYLINPNGILVGPSANINVGSLIASTLDVSSDEFMRGGELNFAGSSRAAVENYGTIRAIEGDIYLIGASVANYGHLQAPYGTVGLAAGQSVRLVDSAHPHLVVNATQNSLGGTGVLNAGLIESLQAELVANGGNVYGLAINNEGTIRATGYEERGGRIFLVAEGGKIRNTGELIAKRGDLGGEVLIQTGGTAGTSAIIGGTIDVSGEERGGQVGIKAETVDIGQANIVLTGQHSGTLYIALGPHSVITENPLRLGQFLHWTGTSGNVITSNEGLLTLEHASAVLEGHGVNVTTQNPSGSEGPPPFVNLVVTSADPDNPFISAITFNLDTVAGNVPKGSTVTFEILVREPDGTWATVSLTRPLDRSTRYHLSAIHGELIEQITINTQDPAGNPVANSFKQTVNVGVAAGVIIVEKQIAGGDLAQQFTFTISGEFNPETAGDDFFKQFMLGHDGQEATNVLAGTYEVAELLPAGWFVTGIDISGGTSGSSSYNLATATATVRVDRSDIITVTFTNTQGGQIIVNKAVAAGNAETPFSFTADGFVFQGSGGSTTMLAHGQTDRSGYLLPGTYTVEELAQAGWFFDGVTGADSVSGRTATVALTAGETRALTFSNTQGGQILVSKFVHEGSQETLFAFNAGGSDVVPMTFQLAHQDSQLLGSTELVGYLRPGAYTVEELAAEGWVLTGVDGLTGFGMLDGRTATIHLTSGDTVQVVFHNTPESRPEPPVAQGLGWRWDPIYPVGRGAGFGRYAPDPASVRRADEQVVLRRPVIDEEGEATGEVRTILLEEVGVSSFNLFQGAP